MGITENSNTLVWITIPVQASYHKKMNNNNLNNRKRRSSHLSRPLKPLYLHSPNTSIERPAQMLRFLEEKRWHREFDRLYQLVLRRENLKSANQARNANQWKENTFDPEYDYKEVPKVKQDETNDCGNVDFDDEDDDGMSIYINPSICQEVMLETLEDEMKWIFDNISSLDEEKP